MNCKHRAGTYEPGFRWPHGGSHKTGAKNLFDRLHILRRCEQASTPLRKNRGDLVVIFFGNEIVEPRRGLEQGGFALSLQRTAEGKDATAENEKVASAQNRRH
jgi:hypothetical protein